MSTFSSVWCHHIQGKGMCERWGDLSFDHEWTNYFCMHETGTLNKIGFPFFQFPSSGKKRHLISWISQILPSIIVEIARNLL